MTGLECPLDGHDVLSWPVFLAYRWKKRGCLCLFMSAIGFTVKREKRRDKGVISHVHRFPLMYRSPIPGPVSRGKTCSRLPCLLNDYTWLI